MKFSIILPIYNVEKYLATCIDSILTQTYTDFEIILVDDGSNDSSPQICDKYSKKDKRVKVIHKINGGQADARNVGLEISKGDYICYIDSDDFLANNNVLKILAEKTKDNPDIVHYKFKEWFESNHLLTKCKFNYDVQTTGRSIGEIYCDLIDKDSYYNSAWSKIIRRQLLIDNNIRFEKGIVGEDNEWYYHVVMAAKSLILVDEALYIYRRRQGSTTTTIKRKNLEDQLYILNKWEDILNNHIPNDRTRVVWGSLAKQYCSALIIYAQIKDVKDLFPKIINKKYLLQFSNNSRVVIFRRIVNLIGIKGLIFFLKIIHKIK